MDDFISLFNSLNLSPINTILLAALYLILRPILTRFEQVEAASKCHAKSLAYIKGHLNIEETS